MHHTSRKRGNRKYNRFAGFIAIFPIAAILLFFGLIKYVNGKRSLTWPSTNGTVISSQMYDRFIGTKSGTKIEYIPDIRYVYFVDYKKYESNRISFKSQNRRYLKEKYPENSFVRVYYDPRNPDVSVLEPGMNVPIILQLILFGLLALSISIASLIINIKTTR